MNTTKAIIVFAICAASFLQAQQAPEANKELVKNKKEFKDYSLDEKRELIRKLREDAVVKDVGVSPEKEEAFRKLFREYLTQQKVVKGKFKKRGSFDEMTEQEAREELEQSFVIGQKLLQLRKEYTKEFLKILTPNQVLKLYHSELKMRESIERYRHNKSQHKDIMGE
ncbi:MAG: hypothetical protein JSS94_02940 [Bacteroidetes bacterium]|nr:hypothetical protein [Bacteroidota bacterium]